MLLLALAPHSAVLAQGVFKCTVDGKTVYQASPCDGQSGKALELARGPSAQQVQEAKKRADAEKRRSYDVDARVQQRAEQRAEQNAVVASKADCAGLNARRSVAYGRRTGAMRSSRRDNIDRTPDVMQAETEIQLIESQMARAGCAPG